MGRVHQLILAAIFLLNANSVFAGKCDEDAICASKPRPPRQDFIQGPPNKPRYTRLMTDAKARIKKVIAKGRTDAQLTDAERAVIKSISSVELLDRRSDKDCRRGCDIYAFAFYLPGQGMCICSEMDHHDDAALFYTIAHEISHAGDICAFDQTGLEPGQHPLETAATGGSVLQCLEINGIRGIGPRDQEYVNMVTKIVPDDSSWSWLPFRRHTIHRNAHDHLHCYGKYGLSQMREASADAFALEALGDYLKEHPFRQQTPTNFHRAFGTIMEHGCNARDQGSKAAQTMSGHPPSIDRLSKIAMAIPALREAFNCSEHTTNLNCEYRPPEGSGAKNGSNTTK